MTAKVATEHLNANTLDLLMVGALSPEQKSQAESHIHSCQRCQNEWAELEKDAAHFRQYVFPKTIEKVEQKLAQTRQSFFSRFALRAWVPVGAFASVLAISSLFYLQNDKTQELYYGAKGNVPASLEVVAQTPNGQQFRVVDGSKVLPKDKLRFVLKGALNRYVFIVSKDGAGHVSTYYPFSKNESEVLTSRDETVPGSVELDSVLGTETLYAIVSATPVTLSSVEPLLTGGAKGFEKGTVLKLQFEKVSER